MKQILTFLLFSFVYLNASNLLYLEQDKNRGIQTYCIDDDFYYDRNRFYFFDLKANRERNINTTAFQNIVISGGWELNQYNDCIFDESKYYGLTYENYNLLMSSLGALWGFLIALSMILAV